MAAYPGCQRESLEGNLSKGAEVEESSNDIQWIAINEKN
jgi:hypothetical protein